MTSNTKLERGRLEFVGLDFDDKKGYVHMVHCTNCSWFDRIYIPYGKTISFYLKDKECNRCKCIGVLY